MKTHALRAIAVLAVTIGGNACADDIQDVRTLIAHTFDRPDAKVVSDPVIVEQDYALADWLQENRGGRTLLRKQEGKWEIMVCAGDSIKQADTLMKSGIPAPTAEALARKLTAAETRLSPAQLHLMSQFRPGVTPDEHIHHH